MPEFIDVQDLREGVDFGRLDCLKQLVFEYIAIQPGIGESSPPGKKISSVELMQVNPMTPERSHPAALESFPRRRAPPIARHHERPRSVVNARFVYVDFNHHQNPTVAIAGMAELSQDSSSLPVLLRLHTLRSRDCAMQTGAGGLHRPTSTRNTSAGNPTGCRPSDLSLFFSAGAQAFPTGTPTYTLIELVREMAGEMAGR